MEVFDYDMRNNSLEDKCRQMTDSVRTWLNQTMNENEQHDGESDLEYRDRIIDICMESLIEEFESDDDVGVMEITDFIRKCYDAVREKCGSMDMFLDKLEARLLKLWRGANLIDLGDSFISCFKITMRCFPKTPKETNLEYNIAIAKEIIAESEDIAEQDDDMGKQAKGMIMLANRVISDMREEDNIDEFIRWVIQELINQL